MNIKGCTNIKKKDIPLHYRNEYSADFLFMNFTGEEEYVSANFTIERNALGNIDISVKLNDDIDYPLLPTISKLKSYITNLEKDGILP